MILLFGLCVFSACFYDTSMPVYMAHLWATIRGISLPVRNSPASLYPCLIAQR
jgi:hypothetical protein